ncbi:ketopantoate reductase family protein [Chloroflexota bacterium]
MDKKIAILATGAIGSSIGADFTQAGYDVLLIDQWPAHVEAMKTRGLRVTKAYQVLIPVTACHLCELASLKPQFDMVFLTSKSIDTSWLVEFIKPYLKPDGLLLSIQNSLNDEWISPIIGAERDIGCALELSAEVFEPGTVQRDTDRNASRFVIGELDGKITPRIQEVAQILSLTGRTEVTANIWGAKWTKLVYNTMNSALGPIGGKKSRDMLKTPKYLAFAIKMGKEAVEVGKALGYILEPVFGMTAEEFAGSSDEDLKRLLLKINTDVDSSGLDHHTAVEQDFIKGRRSEAGEYLNGLVAAKGRQVGVPTPYNDALVLVVRQVEQGKLERNRSTLEMLTSQPPGQIT